MAKTEKGHGNRVLVTHTCCCVLRKKNFRASTFCAYNHN